MLIEPGLYGGQGGTHSFLEVLLQTKDTLAHSSGPLSLETETHCHQSLRVQRPLGLEASHTWEGEVLTPMSCGPHGFPQARAKSEEQS